MNVKKMFASLTGVLMLATTVSPLVTGAATYSDELQGAYDYAYSKGITTMTSIDNANMYWNLTRGQLSKMISQWAEKEMGVKVDETAVCSFSDTNTAEGDLATYVVKACQMGLMGQGIEKFRPNDQVSRGEFGTVLSRAIWGDKYDGATPFYTKHLQALQEAGIMNNISEPNNAEVRGWVMLMLERASETVNPSECDDPAVLFACALDAEGENCPAACREGAKEDSSEKPSNISDMPVAGDLSISVADYSESVRSVPRQGTVVFNAVDFKASEKVVIESIKLERIGLSDKSAVKWVWFEKDGVAVSAKASLSSDGTVTTRFYNNYSVNGTDKLDLVAELNATAGAEIAFKFVDATTSAKNVSLNTQTSTYRTSDYKVAEVEFDISGNATPVEYKVGDTTSYEIGKFKLVNNRKWSEDKDIVVKSLKFKNNGTLDLGETLKNVYVSKDSKKVSSKVELDGKNMTIYFDDEELVSGKSGIYTIFAEVAQLNETNKNVELKLNKESELVANEKTSNFRTTVKITTATLKSYIFQGGKVSFSNDSSLSNTVNAAAGSSDVVIGRGKLTISEPVKLGYIRIQTNESVVPAGAPLASQMIRNLKIKIGGSTYYTTATTCAATVAPWISCTYVTDDGEIYISKTADVEIVVDLTNGVTDGDYITWGTNLINGAAISEDKTDFVTDPRQIGTYDNGDESGIKNTDIAGSIKLSKLIVKAGKFNLTNKNSTTQKVVAGSPDEVTIFDGEITAKEWTVSVNELVVKQPSFTSTAAGWTYGLAAADSVDLTLYIDGESFSTITFRGNDTAADKKFSSLGDVKAGEPMKIKVTATPNIAAAKQTTFSISANGSDSNGNNVVATAVNTAKLEITAGAEISVSPSSTSNAVVRDWANTEIISFTTTVKNGSYDLGKVVATLASASAILDGQSITLEVDGSAVDSALYCINGLNTAGDACSTTPGTNAVITIAGLNETLSVGKHDIALKANLNATNSNSTFTVNTVDLWSTTAWSADKTLTSNAKKLVAKAYPTLSASTSSDDLIITITNPNDSEENIEILGFGVNGQIETASFDDKTIDAASLANNAAFTQAIVDKNVSLGAGDSTELRLQAKKGRTVQVTAIKVKAGDQTYVISSDYTNVGKWTSFKVTAGGDANVLDTDNNLSVSASDLEGAIILSLDQSAVTLASKTGTATVNATVSPSTGVTITNASSDTSKATVNATGTPITVTWVAGGTVTITVTATDTNSNTKTATFTVTVPAS